jgi:hypothetical protein
VLLVGSVPLAGSEEVFRTTAEILAPWLHLPVPRNRTDEAYFAPVRGLGLQPSTELYLGLIHHTDGLDGARQRIRDANRFVSTFGVATECSLGRRPPETIREVLQLHVDAHSDEQAAVQSIVEECVR